MKTGEESRPKETTCKSCGSDRTKIWHHMTGSGPGRLLLCEECPHEEQLKCELSPEKALEFQDLVKQTNSFKEAFAQFIRREFPSDFLYE